MLGRTVLSQPLFRSPSRLLGCFCGLQKRRCLPLWAEAALLPFFFFQQFEQKIRQRLLACKSRSCVGLVSISGHFNSQRLAFAAYLPTPAIGALTLPRGNDVIIVDWVSGHSAD
jgi:hypothetical protein